MTIENPYDDRFAEASIEASDLLGLPDKSDLDAGTEYAEYARSGWQSPGEDWEYEGYHEVYRYWTYEPYAFVSILYNPEDSEHLYHSVEPELDEYEETVKETQVKEEVRGSFRYDDDVFAGVADISHAEELQRKSEALTQKVMEAIAENDLFDSGARSSLYKVLYYMERDRIRYGKIDVLMEDPYIEDISCLGHNLPLFIYHDTFEDLMTNVSFKKLELNKFATRLAQRSQKHISVAQPMQDASLPDGSRLQVTLGEEVSQKGSNFTIRKFKEIPFTPVDLIWYGTFSAQQMAYLWLSIENGMSLIFAGGTASGKTTSMNAVSLFIPPREKIVSIEDTPELKLPHKNWLSGITRKGFSGDGSGAIEEYELLEAALRQRPEYIIMGEVRGGEAKTLFQAMSTGHTTYSTMHADNVGTAVNRLRNEPINVPDTMLTSLDIMSVQMQTTSDGEVVRRNKQISEVVRFDNDTEEIQTTEPFSYQSRLDTWRESLGNSSVVEKLSRKLGTQVEEVRAEIKRRERILSNLAENGVTSYRDVTKVIQLYMVDRNRVLKEYEEAEAEGRAIDADKFGTPQAIEFPEVV